jgi:Family of unknown function (DUF6011)
VSSTICGNCKNIHDSVDEVRACYENEGRPTRVANAFSGPAEPAELLAGVYKQGESLWMVKRAVHGSGKMYAMLINPHCTNCGVHAREHKQSEMCDELVIKSEMVRGAIKHLRSGMRLTLEQAAHYGAIYGFCMICGKTLTDPDSIKFGMGSTCRSKYGSGQEAIAHAG